MGRNFEALQKVFESLTPADFWLKLLSSFFLPSESKNYTEDGDVKRKSSSIHSLISLPKLFKAYENGSFAFVSTLLNQYGNFCECILILNGISSPTIGIK